MRTGAIQGIKCQRAGMSPRIHLSLVENPKVDPQMYALMSTVVNFNVTGLLTGTVGKHNWNCCFGPAAASASEQSRTSCGHTASKLLQYKK